MQTNLNLSPVPATLLVACLCAQWCTVCRDYQARYHQVLSELQLEFPHVQVLWIDVEDHADLVDPIDVDNFPTLLLGVGDQARFFGPLTPHAETLERLVRTHARTPVAPPGLGLNHAELAGLLGRLGASAPFLQTP